LVTGESEEEGTFLLNALKEWLKKEVYFVTLDFSAKLEASVKRVFPNAAIQKCVFHADQLLTRGLGKELTRIKNERLQAYAKEWILLRKRSLEIEKNKPLKKELSLQFEDARFSWQIYLKLNEILQQTSPFKIKRDLEAFFSTSKFIGWNGRSTFLTKYNNIFTKKKFKFTTKGLKYIASHTYKAWRAAILKRRKEVERLKTRFRKVKYLVLTNPLNMTKYQRKKLRAYLKEFPWLRPIRTILVQFYCQFETPPAHRRPLTFLSHLLSENCHPWLKSAVDTLIKNEESVFRFQSIRKTFPKVKNVKSIKVVNESSNKTINQLFRTQCGMRTYENIRMRIAERLKCPIIISPNLLEKIK
jgi:hypothetical protein